MNQNNDPSPAGASASRATDADARPDEARGGETRADVTPGDSPTLAIGMLLFAMFVFTAMDGIAKGLAGQGMPPERIILLRFVLVSAILAPVVVARWKHRPIRTSRPILHILRGVLLIASATLFVYAMRALPLETATAIGFASPLYVTALSIPFLGEKVGMRRWAAVGVGFVGILVILRPGSASFVPEMLIPLFSSLCWACGLIITRAMRGREGPLTILIWSTASGMLVIAPLGIADWETPTATQWLMLAAIAACHAAGQYFTIRAFMMASASLLAPFSYSTIVWASLIGLFAFGSYPDTATIAGTCLLVGAGLYVWHRERTVTGQPTVPGGSISEVAQETPPSGEIEEGHAGGDRGTR
ncbi:MAG: DMT family transporter [Thalassobaculaceae bacterium]|nr:DMT family transporter [Thalassobaculaceae bacterium]